ncbi:trans-aconitate 2-methyltransferase [Conexibacter sp. CPCC 206217]|uniref:class I SAM-dependent methyltransferase n=1 Tax=Conexibacter sp. CPCC 206217 TaxID=3064574 RepID=UPI00271D4B92|nr:class I SAM-dependent methyltransferase [Conexibacter sp. CPCC 206217]MDO8211376.1 class I SAM-dependent methyltransferase [Conexibacter sp. CPCC 206217]
MSGQSPSIGTATVDYTSVYDPDTDFDVVYTHATGRRIAATLAPGQRILELGCATGAMTAQLAGNDREIVAVDRSAPYLARLEARALPGVTMILGDIEHVRPDGSFDHILLTNVLHEVGDPTVVLRRSADWLRPGGQIHATLPNPRSLHRLIALDLRLIERIDELSERGTRFGTRRMLDADALAACAREAGLRIISRGGVLLKPLPNATMAALSPAALELMEQLADQLPEHCAMSYLTLERAGG